MLIAEGSTTVIFDGITTACVLFLFACQAIPNLVKNRTQYYAAFGAVLGIIALDAVSSMFGGIRFAAVVVGFLQLVAVSMLVMCSGGLTVSALAGEMKDAYEVIRRGEDEKEVIVPLTGEQPKPRNPDAPRTRTNIDSPTPSGRRPPEGGIPLE